MYCDQSASLVLCDNDPTHARRSRGLSAADQTALCLSWSQHRRPNCLSCRNTRHMRYQSEKALSVPLRLQSDLIQCTRRAQIRAKQDSGESGVPRFLFPTFGGIVALLPQFILFSGTFNTRGNDPNAMQFCSGAHAGCYGYIQRALRDVERSRAVVALPPRAQTQNPSSCTTTMPPCISRPSRDAHHPLSFVLAAMVHPTHAPLW